MNYQDRIISWDNDQWRVLSQGATIVDENGDDLGLVYVHLASTTRFRDQRNGRNPIQIGDWIPASVLRAGKVAA